MEICLFIRGGVTIRADADKIMIYIQRLHDRLHTWWRVKRGRLHMCHRRFLGRILRLHWIDRVSNKEVYWLE